MIKNNIQKTESLEEIDGATSIDRQTKANQSAEEKDAFTVGMHSFIHRGAQYV